MAKTKSGEPENVRLGTCVRRGKTWQLRRLDADVGIDICLPWVKKLGLKKSGVELWWCPIADWESVPPDAMLVLNDGMELTVHPISGKDDPIYVELEDLEPSAENVYGLGYLYTKEPEVCPTCGRTR